MLKFSPGDVYAYTPEHAEHVGTSTTYDGT